MVTPTIETEHLLLRPPGIDDAQPIFDSYARDPEVTRYLTWRPHDSVGDARDYLSRIIPLEADEDSYFWVITGKIDGQLIGMISLSLNGEKADFGYVLKRAEWGKGIATEALRRVIEFAFSFPEVKRVWGVCDVENLASGRVMEKAGLSLEGRLLSFIIHPNVSPLPRDVCCYATSR
jgi:ribosomal-protein-alanine N-acetyltransferase